VDTSEHLSTQTCSGCVGGPKGLKGLEIREWTCDACGAVHDRDVNAARNILRTA
jgi:putative transposase